MPGDAPRSFREAPSFTPTPAENEAGKTGEPATAETPEPAVIVEVNGKPAAQHPVRATGELSVLRTPERAVGLDTRLPDALWAYDNYPVAENVPPADDQAGVVSLGYIGAAVKRKKKIWLATTAIGVLIAGGLFTTYHPKYTDTTTVLLALDPSLDAATAIQTDAILAVDSNMAQLSMQKLGVHETVPQFLKTYNVAVSTTTNDLLTFTATGPTATAAYNEANVLATTFLQYRAQTELEKESANTAAQDKQVAQTQQTVNSLNRQIRSLKANGAGSGDSRLTRLQTDLVNAQTLLTSLQQNVASTESTQRSTTAGLIAGSSVLDTGIPAEGISQKKFAIEYGGGAIFGGLVLGLLIAAISAIVSDRLRRRDDVAAAIGAPVRVSVASGGGKRSRKAAQVADLKRVAAHLRGAVPSGSDGAGSLAVVAVDDKKFVSEAIREMAVTTGREGKRVVLVDLADGALGALFGTKEPGIRGVDVSGVRVVLVTPERGDLAPVGPLHEPMLGTPMDGITNVHAAADLFITLATVKPATGAAHLKTWADDAVAVVTAGKSSVAKVQAVGEMIRFADARLDSAILLGADEKDESLGFVTA
jgi:capsular polysaccharide biosynthesis protein